jgi:hypothetical protein
MVVFVWAGRLGFLVTGFYIGWKDWEIEVSEE